MRKISNDEIHELRKRGAKIIDEDTGEDFIEKLPSKPDSVESNNNNDEILKILKSLQSTNASDTLPVILNTLTELTQNTTHTVQSLVDSQNTVSTAIELLSKPKSKRKYQCVVGRNEEGNISQISIEEV